MSLEVNYLMAGLLFVILKLNCLGFVVFFAHWIWRIFIPKLRIFFKAGLSSKARISKDWETGAGFVALLTEWYRKDGV